MKLRFLTALGALLCAAAAQAGQTEPVALKWSELGPRVEGQKVALVLPDGTAIQGKVRSVEPGSLTMKISKTSNKRVQPKGVHAIPRQSVSVLQMIRYRKIGRLAFTVGTVAAVAPLLVLGARDSSISEGPMVVAMPAVAAVGTAGLAVGGYYFGKAIDKRVTVIRIVPGD